MNILITGGAGFVGSQLALRFKAASASGRVVAFDNLRRRGAELNLPLFRRAGVEFVHGDIRVPTDLEETGGSFELIIDAAAEPSVLAGLNGSPQYLTGANLVGTMNCLEMARRQRAAMIFLSTSRVYSIAPMRELELVETASRFELAETQAVPGVSAKGIREEFPTHLPRSLYGATKLASEILLQEYVATYGVRAVINRCGVIAGPGQFGKVDQGVFTLWVANHFFGQPLRYIGFGGTGKQVRDLLHPADLFDLVVRQLDSIGSIAGEIYNVGGGPAVSVSLRELTDVCREVVGREVPILSQGETSAVDIPYFVTDSRRAAERFDWKPTRGVRQIVTEIHEWLRAEESALRPLFT
jgi:CDP-paratose 2-epimerase